MDSPVYFVTACTDCRRPILAKPPVHDAFVSFAKAGPAHRVWIGRYVLMPDHFHLFVATDDEKISLPQFVKSLKNALSKTFRARNIGAPHWQKTFFDHVLRSSESYLEKWNYVQENPVRAGLVDNADKWPFQGEIFYLDGPEN